MPAEYGAATVTVLPTRGDAEGLGLTLVERFAPAVPSSAAALAGFPGGSYRADRPPSATAMTSTRGPARPPLTDGSASD
jgi:hypothetical protein